MTKINNSNQLFNALKLKILSLLELVADDVKREIDKSIQDYYDEYRPICYERINQLKKCCKIGDANIVGNTISINVYLDVDSLSYGTKGADPYKTVVAANAGLHGGWNTSNLSSGQVPWSEISGNTGESFGSGTQIWEEPMRELLDNNKLIEIFKKCAKQRGLTIK